MYIVLTCTLIYVKAEGSADMNRIIKKIRDFFIKHNKTVKLCALFILAGGMLFKGLMQIPQIKENEEQIAYLNDRIEYEHVRQAEADELKSKVDTDEYIEKIASDKLGLVKNNAKIFIDMSE